MDTKTPLFDAAHCEPDSWESLDYEGKVLAMRPEVLKEEYHRGVPALVSDWRLRVLPHRHWPCRVRHLPRGWRGDPLGSRRLSWRGERRVPAGLGAGEAGGDPGAETERSHDGRHELKGGDILQQITLKIRKTNKKEETM